MNITTVGPSRPTPAKLRELRMNAVGKKTRASLEKNRSRSQARAHDTMVDTVQSLTRVAGPVVGAAVGLARTGGLSLPWIAAGVVGGFAGAFLAEELHYFPPTDGKAAKSADKEAQQAMNEYKDGLLASAADPELSEVTNNELWYTRRVHDSFSEQWNVLEDLKSVTDNRKLPGWKGQLANASHNPELHSYLLSSIESSEQPEKYTQMFVDEVATGLLLEDEVATKVLDAVREESRA